MALTANDRDRLAGGGGVGLETITVANAGTAQEGRRVIPPGRLLRIAVEDSTGGHVQLSQEYIYGNRFGTDPDVDADVLFDGIRFGQEGDLLSQYWDVSSIVTNTPTLDKTEAQIAQSHVLEYLTDDQDDVIGAWLVRGKRSRYGRAGAQFDHAKIKAGSALTFALRSIAVFVVDATNNKLDFTEGVTGAAAATLTAGTYTADELATEIQTQMDAAATDNTYTCDFDSTATNKFSIVRATGTATIDLNWQSGPNTATTVGSLLGFSVAADDTGATTYSADNAIAAFFQYQLREYRHANTNALKYWDGSAWQTTAQWIDITWNEDLNTFTDAITTDEGLAVVSASGAFVSGPTSYRLFLRPKADTADRGISIADVGIFDTYSEAKALRVQTNTPIIVETKTWTRIVADTDNNSGKVYVEELGV